MNWSERFSTFCFLDNHDYDSQLHSYECLCGAGVRRIIRTNGADSLDELQPFIGEQNTWLMGHLGYDLKIATEGLSSSNPDHIGFPDLCFFEPEIVIRLGHKTMQIGADDPEAVFTAIMNAEETAGNFSSPSVLSRFSKEDYIEIVKRLKQHILRGDCYEINFCQEFFSPEAGVNPVTVYRRLSALSPNPFSALYRLDDRWLICASPERFLKKSGSRIISQPIKGTSKRLQDTSGDEQSRENLYHSAKDRSENVMVVDLVRNDLSRICREGSVKVDELFGIYSFPQVHQMISTISGELNADIDFSAIIRATFPMGSMTGAPKRKVMELIEEYERTKRGIFSGAVGYISPEGDFDFNVVIRSIMYNASSHYLSFQAGSGITWYSDPEQEWNECLLKAAAIRNVLGN